MQEAIVHFLNSKKQRWPGTHKSDPKSVAMQFPEVCVRGRAKCQRGEVVSTVAPGEGWAKVAAVSSTRVVMVKR